MLKNVCFHPKKHKKPLKFKDFCVRVQNCCPIMAPLFGLEPKTPMIKTTPACAGCRKVLFAPLMSGIFLRKPQKLSSVQLSVAYLFLDEDIWFDSRKKSKQKTEAFASVSLFWLPFLDLNQRPPMIKTTPANAGCRKV